jgi:HEAT repeat protein
LRRVGGCPLGPGVGPGLSPGFALKFPGQSADLRNVAIYAASKEQSFDDIRILLANLVRSFEADPTTSRNRIRDLLDNDRELFYGTSIEILKTSGDCRGAHYLVALFVSSELLLRALCDPALSREDALSLGRAAKRVDPLADVVLARHLADSAMGSGAVQVADPARLMDILCEIADAGRIMPSLMRMMRHPNSHLRSKAVKLIGRGSLSARWVMGRLSESDPRVRANAVESLWGVDTPEARTLLSFAANDGDNRVVGNALLGLYYLGDTSTLAEVMKLAGAESTLFRSSAAWVMGEAGDPRFTESLRRMISDPEAAVRKRAFAALAQIKTANAQPPVGERWHVAGRMLAGEFKGMRRLMLAVAGEDMREQPKVAPLQFLLSQGAQYITSYRVAEKPLPESMSVVFVIPRSREAADGAFFQGVLNCLRWKRPSDLWSLLPYVETGDGEPPAARDPEPPLFTSSADALALALRETPKRMECTDLWTALWRATNQVGGQSRGKRHIIVFSSAEEGRIAGHGLIENLQGGRVPIQVICSAPNQHLAELCRRTHVMQSTCAGEELGEMIEQAYLNLVARYEIHYQPAAATPTDIKVHLQTPVGWGETLIAAERQPEEGL